MKKLSYFKKAKLEMADLLSSILEIKNFNRFTQIEIFDALYSHKIKEFDNDEIFDKWSKNPKIESKEDINLLVQWCLLSFKPIKINLDRYLINIKIERQKDKDQNEKYNHVWFEVSSNVKRYSHYFIDLGAYRAEEIIELSLITELNNQVCEIFKDYDCIQDSILNNPTLFLLPEEIEKIENLSSRDRNDP